MDPMNREKNIRAVRELSDDFAATEGRRPRVMLACLAGDENSGSLLHLSISLADLGFDVDVGPASGSFQSLVQQAIENDVHLLGLIFPDVGWLGTRSLLEQFAAVKSDVPIVLFHADGKVIEGDPDTAGVIHQLSLIQDVPNLARRLLGIIVENT